MAWLVYVVEEGCWIVGSEGSEQASTLACKAP